MPVIFTGSYTQNFDTLANTGSTNSNSTLPTNWVILESGTGANTTYAADTGSTATGNTYSYGNGTSSTERALGGVQSTSLVPSFGTSGFPIIR